MTKVVAMVLTFVGLYAASPALACTPPPPPPPGMTAEAMREREQAARAATQAALWAGSSSAFLAFVERSDPVKVTRQVEGRRVVFRPVLTIKGDSVVGRQSLQHTGLLCGLQPEFDILGGAEGDFFVVFRNDLGVLGTVKLDELVDLDAIAAWRARR